MRVPSLAVLDASIPAGPAGLLWHDPRAEGLSHRLPGVHAVSYHPLRVDRRSAASSDIEARVRRPLARAIRRIHSLNGFFETDRWRLGNGAFCEVTNPPTANVSVFAPVCLGPRLYHMQVRGADALPATARDFAAVNLVTGWCLFSYRALRVLGDGDASFACLSSSAAPIPAPIRRIESSPRLTLYELESACRLPWLTADLVALLPHGIPATVTIDVPRVQYYLYLLDAFYRGLVSTELMLRWFKLVDERNRIATELLARQLNVAMSHARTRRHVSVRQAASMTCLEPLIRHSIHSRVPLTAARMASTLSAHDPMWKLVLSAASPASHRELIHLSYVVEQLRGALVRDGEPRLSIAIDNPGEWRAYARARAMAARIGAPDCSLLSLYPLERAFTSEATGRSDLYYNDPGHLFVDRTGRRYDTSQLLARLYPDMEVPRMLGPVAQSPPACGRTSRSASASLVQLAST
jgi:hypothetical protein